MVLLLLLFAGSNLLLSTKPGQDFLQKNLNQRTPGVTWEVAGASWSPWNGITVKKLTAAFADAQDIEPPLPPLLELQEIEIKPYWGQLLRGKKLFREVILDEPQLNIPVELMVVAKPIKPSPPPAPKATPPQPDPPKQAPKPPQKKPAQTPKPPQPKKPEPQALDEKRFWVRLRNAKIRLYSMKLGQDIELHDFNANLPLGGPPTKGSLSWQKITLGAHQLVGSTTLPIEWKSPTWTLANQDLPVTLPQLTDPSFASIPFQMRVGGRFSPRRTSRDFRFQAALPPQPLPDYLLHRESRFHLRAKSASSIFSAQGSLINPNTWRFDSRAALNQIEVFSELRGQHFFFETARVETDLRNATLFVPTFAIRSEQLSLLGNGQLHFGGYLLGVLRIVSAPEIAEKLTRVAIGSNLTGGWTPRWLFPLETPDRLYRDLHFEGFLPDAQVNTGRKGEYILLSDVLRYVKAFTHREVAEEFPAAALSPQPE